jgi:myo-inositol-1(or 4)-monophosphatase
MNSPDPPKALACAIAAARAAGGLMRANLRLPKKVSATTAHDIKLELDVRCQRTIERMLRRGFPKIAILGEEGVAGDPNAERRWVVDPIDGTVNFACGIPHAGVSIALQQCVTCHVSRVTSYETTVGVVYDPFQDELWTAVRGQRAKLNGKLIHVSRRARLREAIVSIGFAKNREYIRSTLPCFNQLVRRVRKIRMMGSAALGLTYVATGRFDAYIERGISLWDIAAGGLIVECAGGEFWREPIPGKERYRMIASSKLMWPRLPRWR